MKSKLALAAILLSTAAVRAQDCTRLSLGQNANLNGFLPFASTDPWNTPITTLPVDSTNTAAFLSEFGGGWLHPNNSIPFTVVDGSTRTPVPVTMTMYGDMSDVMPYPFGPDVAIEGNPASCAAITSDQHAIVIDKNSCVAYETWETSPCTSNGTTTWSAANGAVWDLVTGEKRPFGWTSADAAGLPIFPGLVTYDEAASGSIKHAIRFTLSHTKNNANGGYFTAPATHASGNNWSTSAVVGMRFRLKADFDISSYSDKTQAILTAMKTYGMILADNGSSGFFDMAADPRWTNDDLNEAKSVPLSAFEIVSTGNPVYDATTAPTGAAPVINSFSATLSGSNIVLTWAVTNASYSYIAEIGPMRGNTVTVPTAALTTYTLVATNQFGRTTQPTTVSSAPAASTTSSSSATATTPTTGAWVKIAAENDSITVPAGATVRYGVPAEPATSWEQKTFKAATTFVATNDFFGGDPYMNVVKEVDIASPVPSGVSVNGVAVTPTSPASSGTTTSTSTTSSSSSSTSSTPVTTKTTVTLTCTQTTTNGVAALTCTSN